jgi:hypothetical protein
MSAPEDETVLDVAPGAAGLGLREAETLMRSVPTADPLQVDTRDVTRLHLGNRATIKSEAGGPEKGDRGPPGLAKSPNFS